ncbi:pre-rRNA-processing protein esf2 [Drosophila willistoni]|nr:pre-rRNA-processing protein esf2 [Drosophila willistoni]
MPKTKTKTKTKGKLMAIDDTEVLPNAPEAMEDDNEEATEIAEADNSTGNENDDDDNVDDEDEMDLANFKANTDSSKSQLNAPAKKRKKGIIYISNIPKHMNVIRIREILGEMGKIGRVYLQPEKQLGNKKKSKRKKYNIHFTEGWVEFESKRVAKQIVPMLNNKQISTRKKSQFYDSLWSMKYLPRFKWVHLTERMNYEQAVHKQRLQTEVSQARKETTFFQNNLDKSEYLKKQAKKAKQTQKKEKS